jgi:aryl-alcohol dehydrogenase-like predicted oxidoreductase
MRYRALGKTGLSVSELGFGGWAIGGNAFGNSYGSTDDTTSLAALNTAYALGCTLFDTSDVFGRGHSETLLGHALRAWQRDRIIISTKGGLDFTPKTLQQSGVPKPNFSESHLRQAVEASLKRLGTNYIDLYQLETPPLELVQHARVFDVLKALKQEGKIRCYGITIHDPQEGVQAIQQGAVDAVEAIYNLFDTRLEKALLPFCQQTKTALIAREPLARGFLTGAFPIERSFEKGDARAVWPKSFVNKRIQAAERFKSLLDEQYACLSQLALAYPLANTSVSSVIVGCKTPEQVRENFATTALPPLSPERLDAIRAIQASL